MLSRHILNPPSLPSRVPQVVGISRAYWHVITHKMDDALARMKKKYGKAPKIPQTHEHDGARFDSRRPNLPPNRPTQLSLPKKESKFTDRHGKTWTCPNGVSIYAFAKYGMVNGKKGKIEGSEGQGAAKVRVRVGSEFVNNNWRPIVTKVFNESKYGSLQAAFDAACKFAREKRAELIAQGRVKPGMA